MNVIKPLKQYAGQVVRPVHATLVVSYIAVQGDRGLLAYFTYNQEVNRAAATLQEVQQDRVKLAHRVSLLRPESRDLDLLEERARITLDLVREDEYIVFLPPKSD